MSNSYLIPSLRAYSHKNTNMFEKKKLLNSLKKKKFREYIKSNVKSSKVVNNGTITIF